MTTVFVSLNDDQVRAIEDARDRLAKLAILGCEVGPLVDQLGDILDLAHREQLHSVDYRRIAEDGLTRMSLPDVDGAVLGSGRHLTMLRDAGEL